MSLLTVSSFNASETSDEQVALRLIEWGSTAVIFVGDDASPSKWIEGKRAIACTYVLERAQHYTILARAAATTTDWATP